MGSQATKPFYGCAISILCGYAASLGLPDRHTGAQRREQPQCVSESIHEGLMVEAFHQALR